MRCLYIASQTPISPHYRGGGGAVFYEQLAALHGLGHEITLWHYAYRELRPTFDEFVRGDPSTWEAVRGMCTSVHLSNYDRTPSFSMRARGALANWRSRGRLRVGNPVLRLPAFDDMRRILRDTAPQFIWAQHFGPAQVALLQSDIPVVYSHHDWLYRIKALSTNTPENDLLRRSEEEVARRAAAVVSGSAVECQELSALGCNEVRYLPASFSPVPWDASLRATKMPRIVHLGGFATTATRLGMERFLSVVWPQILDTRVELVVIGDLRGASPELRHALTAATCTGYQPDLSRVLWPYDIHVIPWEHATGQRTRLPMAFNFGQAVVATKAAVRCYPEAIDGVNCLLVDELSEMPKTIAALIASPQLRERLGRAARETFERYFVRERQLPCYTAVIDAALRFTGRSHDFHLSSLVPVSSVWGVQ
jgi:glycosyltransferase involved in cell wall biosynthesis